MYIQFNFCKRELHKESYTKTIIIVACTFIIYKWKFIPFISYFQRIMQLKLSEISKYYYIFRESTLYNFTNFQFILKTTFHPLFDCDSIFDN